MRTTASARYRPIGQNRSAVSRPRFYHRPVAGWLPAADIGCHKLVSTSDRWGGMYRVALVDDEALVRSGLSLILSTAPDIDVVVACDGASASEQITRARRDVVLLDIRMPDSDGLTVLGQLLAQPDPPLVAMLTTFVATDQVNAALRLGAIGYLLKDTEPEQLIRTAR